MPGPRRDRRCAPTWPRAGRRSRRTAADRRRGRWPRRAAARGGCPRGRGRGRGRVCRPAGRRRRADPPASARPRRATVGGVLGEGAVADDAVRTGNGKVQHRRGDHVEAGGSALQADQRAGQPGRTETAAAPRQADGRASEAGAGGRRGRLPDPPSAPPRRQNATQFGRQRAQLWWRRQYCARTGSLRRADDAANSSASSADSDGPAIPTIAAFRSRLPSSRTLWRARDRKNPWPGLCRQSRPSAHAIASGRHGRSC